MMTILEPGRVVLFYRQAQLCTGFICACADQRCEILDESGVLQYLPSARLVLVSQKSYSPLSLATLHDFAEDLRVEIHQLSEQEITSGLARLSAPFSFAEACAALGWDDDIRVFALFHFIKNREDLFSHKKGLIQLRGDSEKQDYLQERRRDEERKEYLQRVAAWLDGLSAGAEEALSESHKSIFLAELRELLKSQQPRDLARLLRSREEGKNQAELINRLRLSLGDISSDTDPVAASSGIPILFPDGIWRQATALENPGSASVEAFSIDAVDSPDHDDAISLRETHDGWLLGIHISDVASRIPFASELWAMARDRVSSLYLPGETVPMLPEQLSHVDLSLVEGTERPVLSLYARLDRDLNLLGHEFRRDWVKIAENLSYEEADSQLQKSPLAVLHRICQLLRQSRNEVQNRPRQRFFWSLKVRDGDIQMRREDVLSPSRFIIEELMILYNRLAAERALRKGLPVFFRNIAQYPEPEDEAEAQFPGIQAYLSTQGKFHPGIGSEAYLHATSPIRRFTDIVNQAQFEALLEGEKWPFTHSQLEELIPPLEKRLLSLRAVAQRSERFWLLRYLEQKHLHSPLDAILLKKLKQGYLAELTAWDKRLQVLCDDRPPLQVPVKLVITSVDLAEMTARADVIN